MTEHGTANTKGKPVAVVVGATSKWQSDGRNTKLAHGQSVSDSDLPVGGPPSEGGVTLRVRARTGSGDALVTAAPS